MNRQDVIDNIGKQVTVDFHKLTWRPHDGKVFRIIKLTKAGMAQVAEDGKPSISVAPFYVELV